MLKYVTKAPINQNDFIITSSGNIVSRSVEMKNAANVELPGGNVCIKDHVILHGDNARIQINSYTLIEERTEFLPPIHLDNKYIPQTIGKNTRIGSDCIIESACIGVGCNIGNHCKLLPRSILKDYVHVKDNTVISPDMVIPPFSIVEGIPGKIVGELPPSIPAISEHISFQRYQSFK